MSNLKISFDAATVTGDRESNQDVFLAESMLSSPDITDTQCFAGTCGTADTLHVFAVCDGIGSHKNSGTSASVALQTVKARLQAFNARPTATDTENIRRWVSETFLCARDAIAAFCRENNTKSSCTLSLLALANDVFVAANTGDSPIFLYTGDTLTELSFRHNVANLKKMIGAAAALGEESILLHHLGEEELVTEEHYGTITAGSIFLLCTDGTANAYTESELAQHLKDGKTAAFLADCAGSHPQADNCTAIRICTDRADARAPEPTTRIFP